MSELRCLKNSGDCFPNLILIDVLLCSHKVRKSHWCLPLFCSLFPSLRRVMRNVVCTRAGELYFKMLAYIFKTPVIFLVRFPSTTAPRVTRSEMRPVQGLMGKPAVRSLVMTHSLLESLVHWNDSSVGMDPSQVSYFQSVSGALPVTLYSGFCSLWKDRVFRNRVRLLLCAVRLLIYLAATVLVELMD